jgi:carbon monoxide dehydrogenase subunit G
MPPLVSDIEIARPPSVVFSYAADPSRFAEWQDDVVGVGIDGPLSVGSRFTTTRRIGRVEHRSTQEVTELAHPMRFAARGVDGPLMADASITVEPLDGGTRSRVTFTLDFRGRGMGKVLVPDVVRRLAQRGAPKSYRNLKERLENDDRHASDRAATQR